MTVPAVAKLTRGHSAFDFSPRGVLSDTEELRSILGVLLEQLHLVFNLDSPPEDLFRELEDDAESLQKIVTLNFEALELTQIPEELNRLHFPNLKSISFANNCITELPSSPFPNCPNLQIIDLQNNQIQHRPVSSAALSQCPRVLFLENNPLKLRSVSPVDEDDCKETSIQDLNRIIGRLRKQKEVTPPFSADLSNEEVFKQLTQDPNRLKTITKLELSGLQLRSIPSTFNQLLFPKLTTLSFANNVILRLSSPLLHNCPKLEHVDLQNNLLSILPEGLCDDWSFIKTIDLSDNLLTELSRIFSTPPSCEVTIYLKGNQISEPGTYQHVKFVMA